MRIAYKLPLAVGLSLLLVLFACVLGLVQMNSAVGMFTRDVAAEVAHERSVATLQRHFATQIQEWKNVLLRGADPKVLAKYWKAFEREEAAVRKTATALTDAFRGRPEHRVVVEFTAAHAKMGEGYRRGLAAFRASNFVPKVGDIEVRGMDREPGKHLVELKKAIAASSVRIADDAAAQGAASIKNSVAIAVALTVLALGIVGWLVRGIVRPLVRLRAAADAIARGSLDEPVRIGSQDEIGRVAKSLEEVRGTLHLLSMEIGRVSADHAAGDTASKMNAASFPGQYRTIAGQIDELLASYVTIMGKVVDCVRDYGRGDFDARLDRLPGELGFINDGLDSVRQNLRTWPTTSRASRRPVRPATSMFGPTKVAIRASSVRSWPR
ncbi:MAG: HAMP domain-containing protein [Burkholderiaceae bacterium]